MAVHGTRVCLSVLLAAVLWPAMAGAQVMMGDVAEVAAAHGTGRPAINATGTSTVQKKPTQLRLYVQLLAKGKTLEDALAKLKERQEVATAQLETLKADAKSVVFGAPSLSNAQSSRKRQIEAMVMAQMRARGKKIPKGLQTPQTVTIASTLTAQWPIEVDSYEKMLLMAQGIQEKIKAADLAGNNEATKPSAEDEEFEEEANQMAHQFGGEEPAQPGQPQYVFVAALPQPEREKAMAEAVAKAKQQAAELAKAAGVQLGPLVGLAGNCAGQNSIADNRVVNYGPYGQSDLLHQMLGRQLGGDAGAKQESIGIDPSALKFTCRVTAVFQLAK